MSMNRSSGKENGLLNPVTLTFYPQNKPL